MRNIGKIIVNKNIVFYAVFFVTSHSQPYCPFLQNGMTDKEDIAIKI